MRVLMTGATGFVGLNIVQALLERGHEVVSFQRSSARRKYLDRFEVRVVSAEFSYRAALRDAARGADAIIHTAGRTSCSWRDINELREANVESTRALLEIARECGVRRFVYTSSTATIGSSGTTTRLADESEPLRGFRAGSPYAQTKQRAEAMLLGSIAGPDCIVLNPAEVIGPFDHTLSWGRMVLAVAGGQLPFIPPGSGTFCHARDVAEAHVAALTLGRHGERYILGGHQLAFESFIECVEKAVRRPARPRYRGAYRLLRAQARLREWLQPWMNPPDVDAYRMRVFGGHHLFDDSKARRELGYAPRPILAGIEECLQWYLENGFLPPEGSGHGVSTASDNEWKSA